MEIRGDGSHQTEQYKIASENLLPNEKVLFVAKEKDGFIVLSDRRFVYLIEIKGEYWIKSTIPLDLLILSEHKKKDTWKIVYHDIDHEDGMIKAKMKKGSVEFSTSDIQVKHAKNVDTEAFSKVMFDFNLVLDETLNSSPYADGDYQPRDYSHLHRFIATPDENQTLLLNTVLSEKPEHNELLKEGKNLVEDGAYMLWNETEHILLAIGKNLCLLISGSMEQDAIHYLNVERFKPERILIMTTEWMKRNLSEIGIRISILRYSTGSWKYSNYPVHWRARESDPRWVKEPSNLMWIISDMMFDKYQELVKANYAKEDPIGDPKVRKQRYYY